MSENYTIRDRKMRRYFLEKTDSDLLSEQNYLDQIELYLNDKRILFPDFDNIFSRSESAMSWWFLPPQIKGSEIYHGENISVWRKDFQEIYRSAILLNVKSEISMETRKASRIFESFRRASNWLVSSTNLRMGVRVSRLESSDDPKDSKCSMRYYFNFFHDLRIEKYWRYWILQKRIINYYHTLFAPFLDKRVCNREVLRLSNRFPEYAHAIDWLAMFKKELYRDFYSFNGKHIEKFFDLQSSDLRNKVLEIKRDYTEITPTTYYQCRVCGVIQNEFYLVGYGMGKGIPRKICSSPACEKAWELLRKKLPPIPGDADERMILLSHL
jgi:hypothetical protein